MRSARTAAAGAVLLVGLLGGCSAGRPAETGSTSPQSSASTSLSQPASSSPTTDAAALPPQLPQNRSDVEEFFSPSRNIACHVGGSDGTDFLGCQALEHGFPDPAPPSDCEGDLIAAVWMGTDGVVTYGMCRGDPFAVPTTTLGYGEATVRGSHACLSEQQGVTCWNIASQHGFRISRASYTVF